MSNTLVLGDLGSLAGINDDFYSIYSTIFDHSKQLKIEIDSFVNCFDGQKANELNTLNNAKQVLSMQTVKDSFNLLENVDNITSTVNEMTSSIKKLIDNEKQYDIQRNELTESHKQTSPLEMAKFLATIEEEKKKSIQDLEQQKEVLFKQYST